MKKSFEKWISIIICIILFSIVAGNVFAYSADVPKSCSIFTVSIGDTVFFGNNEDSQKTGTYMWVVPSQNVDTDSGTFSIYGIVAFGYNYNDDDSGDGYAQGGMNDQGLCADGNGLPLLSLNPHPERESPFTYPIDQILMECSSINEVIDWFQSHNLGTLWSNQLHFADVTGDAVVVSVGNDGELTFTRKGSSKYLVSTNFNLANSDVGQYPCQRYETATTMLETISFEQDLSVEVVRNVLEAIHEEGEYATKYSNIFDPINKDIYVYQNHNFEKVAKLNLNDEVAKVNLETEGIVEDDMLLLREIKIADLFSIETDEPITQSSLISTEAVILVVGVLSCFIVIASYWLFRKR